LTFHASLLGDYSSKVVDKTVYTLYEYDKSEMSTINEKQLSKLIKNAASKKSNSGLVDVNYQRHLVQQVLFEW